MTMAALDHDALLTLARKTHAAASEADRALLVDDLGTLVHALVGHLGRELPQITRLPPAEARLLRRGQARVSAAARALLTEAESGCPGPPERCAAGAEELLALLWLQARDERRAFHRRGAGLPPGGSWSR
jgi:hypothetical protein